MSGIAKEKMGHATSIFNLMRNIGGSFGVAIMTTFLSRRGQFHQSRLAEHITPASLAMPRMLRAAQAWFQAYGFDHYTAYRKAFGAMYGMVQQQAAMLSFVEAFWIMGVAFLLMLPFLLLLRYTKPAAETAPTVRDQVPELLRPAAQPAVPESASEEPVLVSH